MTRFVFAFLILLLPLAAASSAPNASASARRIAEARAFVDRLYAYYLSDTGKPRNDGSVWAPSMLALMRGLDSLDDEAQLEVSGGDEICQCQDWGALRMIERRIVPLGPARAEAHVRFFNLGQERKVRLVLERGRAGWRVADLFSEYRPHGLASYYREAIADWRRAHP